jgi:hypothetical protein
MRRFTHALLLVSITTLPLAAQSTAVSAPDSTIAAFTARLLSAISHRDVAALGSMFKFPVTVRTGRVALPVADQAALSKAFDSIFTPELGCALERSKEATGQSIGGGAVHIQPSGNSFVITRIDEPAGASPAAPRSESQRVDVPSGQVQKAGNLAVGGADRYLVTVRRGDVLQARVERFQGRAIGVRVVDAKSGRALSTAADTARVVSVTAQQAGDAIVEVTRMTFCDPSASYLLTISKRR